MLIDNITAAANIFELADVLNGATAEEIQDLGSDLCALPVYGGDEPRDTRNIWSWDAHSALVFGREYHVEDRPDLEARLCAIEDLSELLKALNALPRYTTAYRDVALLDMRVCGDVPTCRLTHVIAWDEQDILWRTAAGGFEIHPRHHAPKWA